jgi:hypothetical protein
MDLFLATCQGIGLAIAVGGAAGALAGTRGEVGGGVAAVLVAVALIAGGFLFGDSLSSEDHPAWPGWAAGALVALLGFFVAQGLVAGASARAGDGGSPFTLAAYVIAAAAVLAVLSLFVSPVALVAFLGVAWLAIGRRRRAGRKHEGLRVLR